MEYSSCSALARRSSQGRQTFSIRLVVQSANPSGAPSGLLNALVGQVWSGRWGLERAASSLAWVC